MATRANTQTQFTHLAHPAPTAAAVRDAVLADPGFGKHFSDHMVTIDWSEERGWHNATLGPRGPIALDPAAAVLHYAQEIFEGMKAYRLADGAMALFRPEANAARFNASAAAARDARTCRRNCSSRPCANWSAPMRTGSPASLAARSICARS